MSLANCRKSPAKQGIPRTVSAVTRRPARPGPTMADVAELREARKRIRLLEQENEVLRRAAAYLSQANLPGK